MWYTVTSTSWHPGKAMGRRARIRSFDVALYAQTFPPFWAFPGDETTRWKWLGEAVPPLYARYLFLKYGAGGELLDLFAGIGGWSLGFVLTGRARYVEMVEIDRRKCEYLRINFRRLRELTDGHLPDWDFNVVCADVRSYEPSCEFSVIVASPPCEDFSKLRALSREYGVEVRGTLPLTSWYLDFVDSLNPPLALYENVVADAIRELLSRRGWRVEVHDMSAIIPQRWRRLIAIRVRTARLL